jgi:MoaA/NifB/PqqE/SkfB family radical SAM enzyme
MKRLIITYNQSCNLSCNFCYIDFHHRKIVDKTINVVEKAIENGFNYITFGGGDAFDKKSFRTACIIAKENNVYTHVDTNAVNVKSSDVRFINNYVDLLGISIDAIGRKYDDFRNHKDLFEKVNSTIIKLDDYSNVPIKINTIVTKENMSYLPMIRDYILQFRNIKRWCLYQFFPLSAAKINRKKYEICDSVFDLVTQQLDSSIISIECWKYVNRITEHLFCDEEGNLYTNSTDGDYVDLFSLFDKDVKAKLDSIE